MLVMELPLKKKQTDVIILYVVGMNSNAMHINTVCVSYQGLGTTDSVLIRIMVARAEIDMLDIKAQFLKNYGKTLHSFIKVRL